MKKQYIQFSADAAELAGVTTEEQLATQPVSLSVPNFDAIVAAAEELAEDEGYEELGLSTTYKEFTTAGEASEGVYMGIKVEQFLDEDATTAAGGERVTRDVKIASWYTKDKQCLSNGGVTLIQELEKNNLPIGTKIRITLKEKKGRTKIFKVGVLVKKAAK